ncbi:hypothetical protein HPULCUR_004533 [Helicostylum pulchrum]|uniref:Uncharacterized protein n=1 Tax=Helicostylum pulchrum TaxID=562976 RepID=A0ABP9XWH2_9FUNG
MMEPPQKLVVVKSSITGIGWKDAYKQRLMELVKNVNIIATHTYFFLNFIFVNELEDDNTDNVFNLEDLINEDFFREVFMSLLSAYKVEKRKKTEKLETFKTIINKHRETFLERTSYKPIDLKYGQQITNYEVTKIRTAYINNVTSNFGNKLRKMLNLMMKKKDRLQEAVKSKEDRRNDATSEFLGQDGMNTIRSFIGCYSEDYKFEKGSIFYDCKANPVKHLRAYYQIAKTCEALQGGKSINCFPIRTTFIPCYMTIDTLILNTQIFKNMVLTHLDKQVVWGGAINLNSKGMESQGPDKQMTFRGMLYTDGVGVSILKKNHDPRKRGGKKSKKQLEDKDSFKYIEDLKKEDLLADVGKCVLVDPGRRDLLYCMHENSTSQTKMVYIYTKLRNRFKPDEVIAAELSLSYHHVTSVNKENFVKYLEARANVSEGLNNYYGNEDIPPGVRAADRLPFRRMKLSSVINMKQSEQRLAKKLRQKFGQDSVIIIGNWTAANVKYHEPTKGVGIRNMLRKEGFKVYLLDEFKTSSLCPSCKDGATLEIFKEVKNSRPFRLAKNPTVICHGLLRLNTIC